MKLSELKPNPDNPRVIKDAKFEKLKQSIQDFPKMMSLRPIIVDNNNVILGGNMRLRALQDLKYKEIPDDWVKRADELTEEEKKQFIIKDNVGFGEWDWDLLANEWDNQELNDWGLDVWQEEKEKADVVTKEIEPYKQTHILLSFEPDKLLEIQSHINEILKISGVEYEQSSN